MAARTPEKSALRTILIDDEPLALGRLRRFLGEFPELTIVEECLNGFAAVRSIKEKRPDLIFLDIHMPEMDGFAVLNELSDAEMPAVIFMSAYDEYAVRAFEIHAVDYVLKPYSMERLRKAVARALSHRERSDEKIDAAQIRSMLEGRAKGDAQSGRLLVKENDRIIFVKMDEIDWIEASKNYIILHCGANGTHVLRETLTNVIEKLDPKKFLRVHRCTVVNMDRIKEMHPLFNGEYKIILTTNHSLIMSRSYREKFKKEFGSPL